MIKVIIQIAMFVNLLTFFIECLLAALALSQGFVQQALIFGGLALFNGFMANHSQNALAAMDRAGKDE